MKKTVLVVWVCWWMSQCLCNQYLPKPFESNPRPHTWRPSPRHSATGQSLPSSNSTTVRSILSRNSPHPAPGVTENTHYITENTSHIVLTMNKTDKVHYGTSGHNAREHIISPSVPPVHTNTENPEHSAGKNFSTGNDSTTDKGNQEGPLTDPSSEDESHGESSLSSRPPHDHKPLDITGGGREGHGRVTTGPKDLCSFCLCDTAKKNVFCKHEHTNHNHIHNLTLHHQVIPPSAETLHIAGFEEVVIMNNTFSRADLKLRNIHFEGIAHMKLLSNSLHFSAKAECNITSMRSYALYNARLLYFHMTETKVEVMEENSIHLDSYFEWMIEKSQLPNMIQKSICLRAQNIVVFSHNTFLGLGNRSLDIISSSQVLFEFNHVSHLRSEALLGIKPHKDARAANIVFLNNTIAKADERSLLTSKQYPMHERKIIDNKFNILCDCNVMMTFEKLLGITNISSYSDQATFKAVTQKSFCQVYANVRSYTKVVEYVSRNCILPITAIVAGTTVAVVILLLVVVCVVCTKRVQKAREEANYLGECCFSQSFSTLRSNPQLPMSSTNGQPSQSWEPTSPLQPWVVAVPEVKTYKEMELNVAYEHTEPMNISLRDSFPHEPGPLFDLQCRAQMRSSCPFN